MLLLVSRIETVTMPTFALHSDNAPQDVIIKILVHPPLIQMPSVSFEVHWKAGMFSKNPGQSRVDKNTRLLHLDFVHVKHDLSLVNIVTHFIICFGKFSRMLFLFTTCNARFQSVDGCHLSWTPAIK